MTGLRKPPKQEKRSRVFLRLLVLALLLLIVAIAIWTATTRTLIRATEDVRLESLEVETRREVDGTTVNVVVEPGGPVPVLLLNGYDIAGSAVWDGVVQDLGERYHAVRIDLPGFGMSDRIPERGPQHTVASMTQVVAAVIEADLPITPIVVGVGLGGEVAAELAVTHGDMVRGLVLVDVDFWEAGSWLRIAEKLPFVGEAVTYTFEGGGRLGGSTWAPWCGEGGWCPTGDQRAARELAASIVGSTSSLQAFLMTRPASLVPSDLDLIDVGVAYVWSESGSVPRDSVDRVAAAVAEVEIISVAAFQSHLEEPQTVVDAIEGVDG